MGHIHTEEGDCYCAKCQKKKQFYRFVCSSLTSQDFGPEWHKIVSIDLHNFNQENNINQQTLLNQVTDMIVQDRKQESQDPDFLNHSRFNITIYQLLRYTMLAGLHSFGSDQNINQRTANQMAATFLWTAIGSVYPWD